ncbi:diguanylate cyclase [Desulfosediminicola flagellatus]|uniref:diguanylate cyclase n=1 Tax=Desulfosediminicola flagellatus TaxID=2569541 RepID=UPI0010AB6ED0|nr:diguanylate cyclase [Desulfosediminicola flagellatus]
MEGRILIVEDAKMFSRIMKNRLEQQGFSVNVAESMQEAKELTSSEPNRYFLAILDLNLPDAPNGEVVDYVLDLHIPVIVFTGLFSDEIREMILNKKVVDYVVKDDPSSIDYVISLASRILENRHTKILAVDDSKTSIMMISNLLERQKYQVLSAINGVEALEVLKKNDDIKVVLTDYMMPEMDGFELTKAIRREYSRNKLAVIGISAHDDSNLSAKFMKHGASDFISKPFSVEEFNCRVNQNVQYISHINALNEAVIRDYMTGLHNRRYFFDLGQKLFASAIKKNTPLAVAMLDIDHFKKVNDTYGHDAGDTTLIAFCELLKKYTSDVDIIARMGGEEFAMLITGMSRIKIIALFETLRQEIEDMTINCGGVILSITASIGVCCQQLDSLDAMIANADELLYESKDGGRNQVTLSSQNPAS